MRTLILATVVTPVVSQGATSISAFLLLPDRTMAMVVVAMLFYFGFKWRNR